MKISMTQRRKAGRGTGNEAILSHGKYMTPGALCSCSGVCVIDIIIPPFVYSSDTRRAEYPEHSSSS